MPRKGPFLRIRELPTRIDEVDSWLQRIAELQRRLQEIHVELNGAIDRLTRKAQEAARPIEEEIELKVRGLRVFAKSRRSEITDGGRRQSMTFTSGTIGWRWTPLAISISNYDTALAALKAAGLREFIRVREEIDRQEIRKHPELLPEDCNAIKTSRREEFFVQIHPTQSEYALVRDRFKIVPKKRRTA